MMLLGQRAGRGAASRARDRAHQRAAAAEQLFERAGVVRRDAERARDRAAGRSAGPPGERRFSRSAENITADVAIRRRHFGSSPPGRNDQPGHRAVGAAMDDNIGIGIGIGIGGGRPLP